MNFGDFLHNVNIPALVYREDASMAVVYENRSAILQLNPLARSDNWDYLESNTPVTDLLRFVGNDFATFQAQIARDGDVSSFHTSMLLYTGEQVPVSIAANRVELEGVRYVQVLIYSIKSEDAAQSHAQALATALDLAYRAPSTDEAINNVIAFVGNYTDVSRSYIFEAVSETLTSNTYEWCANGVEPAIEQLKNLPKDEYSYDNIIENGLAVTDDIRMLTDEDRAILEPQGIKSLALIPIYSRGRALGYIGFDDCARYRQWSPSEVQLLQSMADMIASLLARRDAERSMQYSIDVLKNVTDNSDNIVFVSDIYSRHVLFANSVLARAVGAKPEELTGLTFHEVAEKWSGQSADYRPLDALIDVNGAIKSYRNTWEFKNPSDNKWYLITDSIIKWIDGKDAHIETATEITGQKEYEAELKHAASTDRMTGLYNRERGRQLLQHILSGNSDIKEHCLVFIDLDGLKYTNDTFGHEVGDLMIQKTITLIQSRIRKIDTLCRWGGDEFLLILSTNENAAGSIMETIAAQMEQHNESGTDAFTLSFSYGITPISPDEEQTVDELVKTADARMYSHKMRLRKHKRS